MKNFWISQQLNGKLHQKRWKDEDIKTCALLFGPLTKHAFVFINLKSYSHHISYLLEGKLYRLFLVFVVYFFFYFRANSWELSERPDFRIICLSDVKGQTCGVNLLRGFKEAPLDLWRMRSGAAVDRLQHRSLHHSSVLFCHKQKLCYTNVQVWWSTQSGGSHPCPRKEQHSEKGAPSWGPVLTHAQQLYSQTPEAHLLKTTLLHWT